MDDIAASPTLSATSSPGGSPKGPNSPVNPFHDPLDSQSPYDDSHEQPAIMDGLSLPPRPPAKIAKGKGGLQPQRPIIMVSASSFLKPHPPKPLGLPSPRTPPPANMTGPPAPIASPVLSATPRESEELKESRWWHDYLCGCNEGKDRGGEHQVDILFCLIDYSINSSFTCYIRPAGRTHSSNTLRMDFMEHPV
jgi:hypothetical protein